MKQKQAIDVLLNQEKLGRYVFTGRDLAKLFSESGRMIKSTLTRLVNSGVLIRGCRGVYVFALSRSNGSDTLEYVARAMRRGEYSYVSLESALSEYGVISQIPIDRLTVMTTGRRGEYKTPFGVIEFTHTQRSVRELIASMQHVGRPLRLATKLAAWRDLKRVGRNTHLVDLEVLYEN